MSTLLVHLSKKITCAAINQVCHIVFFGNVAICPVFERYVNSDREK